jgi:hypothetical protein
MDTLPLNDLEFLRALLRKLDAFAMLAPTLIEFSRFEVGRYMNPITNQPEIPQEVSEKVIEPYTATREGILKDSEELYRLAEKYNVDVSLEETLKTPPGVLYEDRDGLLRLIGQCERVVESEYKKKYDPPPIHRRTLVGAGKLVAIFFKTDRDKAIIKWLVICLFVAAILRLLGIDVSLLGRIVKELH